MAGTHDSTSHPHRRATCCATVASGTYPGRPTVRIASGACPSWRSARRIIRESRPPLSMATSRCDGSILLQAARNSSTCASTDGGALGGLSAFDRCTRPSRPITSPGGSRSTPRIGVRSPSGNPSIRTVARPRGSIASPARATAEMECDATPSPSAVRRKPGTKPTRSSSSIMCIGGDRTKPRTTEQRSASRREAPGCPLSRTPNYSAIHDPCRSDRSRLSKTQQARRTEPAANFVVVPPDSPSEKARSIRRRFPR
jgi:hypothetical protein